MSEIKVISAYIKAKADLAKVTINKSATNPFFKSSYAELKDYLEVIEPVLESHGLAVAQFMTGEGGYIEVETVLYHTSGESIRSGKLALKPTKEDPQQYGSAGTYARRYSLSSFFALTAEDDDGNMASEQPKKATESKPQAQTPLKPALYPSDKSSKLREEHMLGLLACEKLTMPKLVEYWKDIQATVAKLQPTDREAVVTRKDEVKGLLTEPPIEETKQEEM